MSDDKKRDRALQRRVRERQAKTGESYQAAWRQLTDSEAPSSDESDKLVAAWKQLIDSDAPSSDKSDELVTKIDPDEERPASWSPRLIIPLHLPRVPPHHPTRVEARAAMGAVDVEGVYISGAGTPGGTADWVVNDIEIDGRSQLTHKDLPGSLFGSRGVAASRHGSTALTIKDFDPVERDHALVLVVTYVGPNPEGVPFFASVVGRKPRQRPTIVPIASKTALPPMKPSGAVAKATISARVQNATFQMSLLEIDDGDTAGGAADWLVEDLRVNGRTQFAQPGPIPGDMFSTTAIDSFVKIEPCEAGNAIEIDVNYIGLNESGAIFAARLEGTVTRDDYSVPPPDLHVIVETSGQGPGDIVIASCNWRAPATDNCTR
jgi:hypothetical protein